MKKILLLSLGISLILISGGCKIQFWPSDEGPEGAGITFSDEKASDKVESPGASDSDAVPKGDEVTPGDDKTPDNSKSTGAPGTAASETTRTTGKIYAKSFEGIRPLDAINQRERSPISVPEGGTKTTFRESRSKIKLATKETLNLNNAYWYECNYYGDCWDSEDYIWYDCLYDAYAVDCEAGNYWLTKDDQNCDQNGLCKDPNGFKWYDPSKDIRAESQKEAACCDSWGNCYDKNSIWMADPKYMTAEFCDECGNCYDYYGNFVYYDEGYYDSYLCDNFYYYYDSVAEWDICGNAYDKGGKFLFYDNYYYDYQSCNLDYSACTAQDDAINCDGQGTCYYEDGKSYKDPYYLVTDFCDECGNCYDFYGNETEFDSSYIDDYWCSQYYQYDKVDSFDTCGNAYDKNGEFLFYDNEYYDYKVCYGLK